MVGVPLNPASPRAPLALPGGKDILVQSPTAAVEVRTVCGATAAPGPASGLTPALAPRLSPPGAPPRVQAWISLVKGRKCHLVALSMIFR